MNEAIVDPVPDLVTVEILCPDRSTAAAIAEALLSARLAACANLLAPCTSLYHWKGAIERAEEMPLVLKTRASLFPALVAAVRPLHPYETPAIMAQTLTATTDDYRAWILAETTGA